MSWVILFGTCLFTTSLLLTLKLPDFIFKYMQIISYCLWIEKIFTFFYIFRRALEIKLAYFCLSLPLYCCFYFSLHLFSFKSYLLIFLMLFRYQHTNIFYCQPYSLSVVLRSPFNIYIKAIGMLWKENLRPFV